MVSLLSGLSGKLLGELCSPFLRDVGKSWGFGAKNEFKKLKNTLSAIESVLLDAEEKQRTNHQVQDWLKKIKLVLYDVEDLLLEISTEALKRHIMTRNRKAKKVHIFFSRSNQVMYRLRMGRKIKLIREELDAIASDQNCFNLIARREEMHVIGGWRREETHSFMPMEKFVGRKEDKRIIIERLFESNSQDNVSVVSIVGIGGVGKTTLAQSVYNTDEVKDHFELTMWVSVSIDFDVRLVCEKIIESVTKINPRRLRMDGVLRELKNAIDGRKYLLVLDDVWNESPVEWLKLEELLMGGAKGSKILLTARAGLVARAAKSIAPHCLERFSYEESWALFKRAAFKQEVEPESSTMVRIGNEVVRACCGVPLAIKTIGSMLGMKEKESDWLDFEKNDLHRITLDSKSGILPILKLSYDKLSSSLKRCFAYSAVFPKNWKMEKNELIRMWMAQGLIQSDGTTRSLEDVGEQHIMELLDRSIFEACGNVSIYQYYKIHDLTHDVALSVGGNECFNSGSNMDYVDETTRHAWVKGDIPTILFCAEKLRTFIHVSSSSRDSGECESICDEVMSGFKRTRVLDLMRSNITLLPHFVSELRYLSYLNLSHKQFDLLPESICKLYNLQTLLLVHCGNLHKLPNGIRNLVSLRHLDISYCDQLSHMPRGLGELTCLQTLTDFVMGQDGRKCGELDELKSLVNLRGFLRVTNLTGLKVGDLKRDQSCYLDLLSELKSVQILFLVWKCEDEVKEEEAELLFESLKPHYSLVALNIFNYGGTRFPSWMDSVSIGVSLLHISCITIDNCQSCNNLPPFGLLPFLRDLKLQHMSAIEYIYKGDDWNNCVNTITNGVDGGTSWSFLFPSLRELSLYDMPKLVGLERRCRGVGLAETSHNIRLLFPLLETLVICNCPLFVADGNEEEDGKQFMSFTKLCKVELVSHSDMETPRAWLQYLPSVQTLKLACNNIVTLPEWMGNLTSLQELHLQACRQLASIPNCMQRLTSLKRLVLKCCDNPKLLARCEKEIGDDWHNIAHIPDIYVTPNWWE